MLKIDKNKIQYLNANTGAPFAMLRGLGLDMDTQSLIQAANQFNPEPISHAAIEIMGKIEQFFGIGRGRKEANQIVPMQNEIHHRVLAPIAEAVNAEYASQLNRSQLNQMLDALLTTKQNWLDFLHNTQWTDGRAATQAENTLAFLFDDQERKARQLLPNAPYFAQPIEIPTIPVIPIGGTPGNIPIGGGNVSRPGSGTPRYTPSLPTGLFQTGANVLPWILGAALVMILPKIGKYQR